MDDAVAGEPCHLSGAKSLEWARWLARSGAWQAQRESLVPCLTFWLAAGEAAGRAPADALLLLLPLLLEALPALSCPCVGTKCGQ